MLLSYVKELIDLIKMADTILISPKIIERVHNQWLEVIPASKLFASGGDYAIVEGALGRAIITCKAVSNVLQD